MKEVQQELFSVQDTGQAIVLNRTLALTIASARIEDSGISIGT